VKDVVMPWALRSILFSYLLVWVVGLHLGGDGWGFMIILVPIKYALTYSMAILLLTLCHFLHGCFQDLNPPQVEHFLLPFECIKRVHICTFHFYFMKSF